MVGRALPYIIVMLVKPSGVVRQTGAPQVFKDRKIVHRHARLPPEKPNNFSYRPSDLSEYVQQTDLRHLSIGAETQRKPEEL